METRPTVCAVAATLVDDCPQAERDAVAGAFAVDDQTGVARIGATVLAGDTAGDLGQFGVAEQAHGFLVQGQFLVEFLFGLHGLFLSVYH